VRSFDFATDHELKALKKRVDALEAKQNGAKAAASAKTAKKETAAKS
jgi:BMFP domain-containing protein YqiC